MRTCHLPCAARLLNRSSSPSGALQTIPDERFDEPARTLRVEEIFHLRGLISPHMAGISSLGRRGCLQDGRGEAGAPDWDSADDFCPRRLCSAPRGALQRRSCIILLSSSLRRAVDPGDDPGVYRAAMCMFWTVVLPAMPVASSFSRAAVERVYCQKGPRLVDCYKKCDLPLYPLRDEVVIHQYQFHSRSRVDHALSIAT